MEPDRWQRITAIFHAALERPPAERERLLDEACAGDAALRAEVAALVAHHETSEGFLETPAAALPGALDEAPLSGATLGPYRVDRVLGRGGMGCVYRAEDLRLGRLVSVKALAPEFVADARQRERLRRGARAAAALSHPGIAAVHALEEIDGHLFAVGEYVEGETLRTELSRGPLAPDDLVGTALAIASALAHAHAHGVIHRDLKPENVIRGRDGQVKILDFGVARVTNPREGPLQAQLTESGALVGTPAYMSPEQLRGEEVDFRTDIFSFGTLVYELATGRHPFAGDDAMTTMARILDAVPPAMEGPAPLAPGPLTAIVGRALAKRPQDRYANTRELVADLERVRRTLETGRPVADAAPAGQPQAAAARSPVWWWRFHQTVVGSAVLGLLAPLWWVRPWLPVAWDPALFFAALATALVAAPLRFHLAFASRYYPTELDEHRRRVRSWVARADAVFTLTLATTGWLLVPAHNGWAALHFGSAVALAVTAIVIEPVTARAAFGRGRA